MKSFDKYLEKRLSKQEIAAIKKRAELEVNLLKLLCRILTT